MTDKEKFHSLINNAKKIVFFTGAGISVASGIDDIRGDKQLENEKYLLKKYGYTYEEIVSHTFFNKHPDIFYDYFFNEMLHKNAKPNQAHKYIAELDKNHFVNVITQNIDDLHNEAGSKIVIELHGNAKKFHCQSCHEEYSLDELTIVDGLPRCQKCNSILKPEVVLFEEPLDQFALTNAVAALSNADLVVVIGSSLVVNPAASLLYYTSAPIIIVNKNKTPFDDMATLVIHDNIVNLLN